MIFDCLDEIDTGGVVEYVAGLQTEDGSFMGDQECTFLTFVGLDNVESGKYYFNIFSNIF